MPIGAHKVQAGFFDPSRRLRRGRAGRAGKRPIRGPAGFGGETRAGRNAMARWSGLALGAALAALLPTAALAQTTDDPSFFESLWSGISGAVERLTSDGEDAAAPDPPTEAGPGQPAPGPPAAPSLSSARWVGFTPVIVGGAAAGEGAWIAGPFVEAGAIAWVTDTVSGLTVEARLVWCEAAAGSLAELSAEAGRGLGLSPGAVANVTIYLAR